MNNTYIILKEYAEKNIPYILIQTPYGICKQRKNAYLKGHVVTIQSAINKTEYYINQYLEKFKNNLYDLSFIKYIDSRSKILVKNQYGLCMIRADAFLRGQKPAAINAINKTEYFINQAREIHGDKYDYSKVNYINNKTKVIIISKYGEFLQTPGSHLAGDGCPILAKERLNHVRGWSLSSWEQASQKSKNFTSYKLYFIKCWDENESFYKIGITFTDIKNRFKYKHHLPYNYKILKILESKNAKEIFELEKYYKYTYKNYKYIPIKNFGGKQECFSVEINL